MHTIFFTYYDNNDTIKILILFTYMDMYGEVENSRKEYFFKLILNLSHK